MDVTVINKILETSPQVVGAVVLVFLFLRHIRETDRERTEAQTKRDQTETTLEMADDARQDKIGQAMEEIGRLIGQNTAALNHNSTVLAQIDDFLRHGRAPVEHVPDRRVGREHA